MGLNPELPISFAASALKNLLITDMNGQEISYSHEPPPGTTAGN